MKKTLLFLPLVFICTISNAQVDSLTLIYQNYIDSVNQTFVFQKGTVQLDGDLATLNIPEGYKFLDNEQSHYVLTEIWGNPPSDVLGMLFPENTYPLSNDFTYAVEIKYSEEGYIDDKDAKDINYNDLLEQMIEDANNANKERIQQGYEPAYLMGWASAPFYDSENKKLHWAKEIKFGESEVNTLNYNIRILGRKGYLNLNAIGDMDVLPLVESDIEQILASVEFNDGYRYSDFNPDFDKVAAYGIGSLIAGKVLSKAGFFAVILKFWKIIAVALVAAFSAFKNKIIALFKPKEKFEID